MREIPLAEHRILGRGVEDIWNGNEFPDLHAIIEKYVADDINRMLGDDWLPFIDMRMRRG